MLGVDLVRPFGFVRAQEASMYSLYFYFPSFVFFLSNFFFSLSFSLHSALAPFASLICHLVANLHSVSRWLFSVLILIVGVLYCTNSSPLLLEQNTCHFSVFCNEHSVSSLYVFVILRPSSPFLMFVLG